MIKTISLTANEEKEVELTGGCHCCIENRGNDVIYVSKNPDIQIGADGVLSVGGGCVKTMRNIAGYSLRGNTYDYYGTIYMISASDGTAEIQTANILNFGIDVEGKNSASSGGGSVAPPSPSEETVQEFYAMTVERR